MNLGVKPWFAGEAVRSPDLSRPFDVDRWLAVAAAVLAIGIAGVAATGWFLDNETLKTVWPDGAQVKPATAAGLTASAASLVLAEFLPRALIFQRALAVAVAAVGCAFLLEYTFNADFGFDTVLFPDPSTNLPGRPSVATSASLVALGLALALFRARSVPLEAMRGALAIIVIVLALTGLLGYLVSPIDPSVQRTLSGFAFPTAVAFLALGLGALGPNRTVGRTREGVSVAAPILGLAAMATLIVMTLTAVDAQRRARMKARDAETAVDALGGALDLLRDAETGQRGYLLTGIEDYLQTYEVAAPLVAPEMARIAALVGNDAEARDRLNRIRSLAERKLAELRRTIDLQRAGDPAGALAIVRSGYGKRTMDRARSEVAAMQGGLRLNSSALFDSADRMAARLQYTILMTVSLVVGLAAFLAVDGRRRFAQMRETQQRLAAANSDLDRSVAEKTSELSSALDAMRVSLGQTKAAQAELADREARLLSILETVPSAMIVIDEQGLVTSFSTAAAKLFGYRPDEVVGRNVKMLMPEPYRAEHDGYVANYLRSGEARIIGYGRLVRAVKQDGTVFPIELSVGEARANGRRIFTGFIRDLTSRQRMEEELRQAQKMEAVGQLTGGIAHDFNNMLTAIIANLELLFPDLEDRDQRELVNEAQAAALDCAKLASQLLAFGRRQPLNPEPTDIRCLVATFAGLLRRTLGESIELELVAPQAAHRTVVDAVQFQNALLNLALNARDAMPHGGRLTIAVSPARLDAAAAQAHPEVRTGHYVLIAVSDTGAGMSEEVRSRAFEPFFTTKPMGAGTGLGLSMVYGFVKQTGGHIELASEPGRGTSVRIYLPVPEGDGVEARPASATADAQPSRGSETILLVEDDVRLRRALGRRLRSLGYRVFEADSGPAAMAELTAMPEVALLFTDMVMTGGMNGLDLAEAALAQRPELKVLFTSGYATPEIARLGRRRGAWLRKPYTAEDLARTVREVLQDAAG